MISYQMPDGSYADKQTVNAAWQKAGYVQDPNGRGWIKQSQANQYDTAVAGRMLKNASGQAQDVINANTAKAQAALTAAADKAAAAANPWGATQTSHYQTSLSQLMDNPGAAMQDNPFFKWQQQQGEQAVNRAAASNGQLGSGNRMTALSDYAQKQSGNNFFQLADLYSLLGGAKNQNAGGAAQIQYQGAQDAAQVGTQGANDVAKLIYGGTHDTLANSLDQQAINNGVYQYNNNFNNNQNRYNAEQNAWQQAQQPNYGMPRIF
jgi:cell division septum initiation protein DivIVA